MTPEEAWSGERPAVDHFQIFGCVAYAHIPDQKRRKLDDKGEKSIFLGVSEQSKAYKLYNPITKKIVISRDVIFDEGRFWICDKDSVQQHIQVDFDGGNIEERLQPSVNVQPATIEQQPIDNPHISTC